MGKFRKFVTELSTNDMMMAGYYRFTFLLFHEITLWEFETIYDSYK